MTTVRTPKLLMVLFLCTLTSAYGEVILKTNFAENLVPINSKNATITGSIPKGWREDSSWCDVVLNYSKQTFQNHNYLQMSLDKINRGFGQFCYPELPDAEANTVYRLTVRLRNRTQGKVRMGLRRTGAPYSYYWNVNDTFSRDWQTYTYTFQMKHANTQKMGFWFGVYDLGSLDLDYLELIKLSKADIDAHYQKLAEKYPDGGPINLMRNTHLTLGLQSGWSLYRKTSEGDDVIFNQVADPSAPSGLPVFRINSRRKVMQLISEPFRVIFANKPHTCRLVAKGEGSFVFRIKHQNEYYKSIRVNFSPDKWKTVNIPFKADMFAACYQLVIEGKGVLDIDSIRVAPTESIKDCSRPEVALAIPESETAVSRIQFSSQPAVVNYCVTNLDRKAVLKSEVTNIYGETRALEPVAVDGKISYGQIKFDVFPNQTLGCFRVVSWLEQNDKPVSPVNELVVTRLRKPRYWGKDAPNSPFGAHLLPQRRSMILAKACGINWTRLHDAGLEYIGWWKLEPEKGKWVFYDEEIKRYRGQNLMIFGELGTAPAWASYYSKTGRTVFSYFDKFFQPLDLKDYRNYVSTVVERYKNDIAAYDVWNEPWIHAWWGVAYDGAKNSYDRGGFKTSKEPQKDFTELMKAAYYTTKVTDSKITIAGFNTTSTPSSSKNRFSGSQWTEGVLKNGGLNYCDVLAYHGYDRGNLGYPGDPVEKGLQSAFGPVLKQFNGKLPKPVWMTEGSPLNETGNGLYKHTLPFHNNDAYQRSANDIARYMMSLLANKVERHFLYSIHCHTGMFAPNVSGCRMLTTIDGYPHPTAVAHSAFAYLIEDTTFVKRLELSKGVYAYLFKGDGRSVVCVSTAPDFETCDIPAIDGMKAIDLYGNPLAGDLKAGPDLFYLTGPVAVEDVSKALAN